MFNLGPLEVVAILVVALVVFGPSRLPEMARQVGKAVREVRKFQSTLQDEVKGAFDTEKPKTGWEQSDAEKAAAASAAAAFSRSAATAATAATDGPAEAAETTPAADQPPAPIPGQEALFGEAESKDDVPAGPDETTPR